MLLWGHIASSLFLRDLKLLHQVLKLSDYLLIPGIVVIEEAVHRIGIIITWDTICLTFLIFPNGFGGVGD